MGVTLEVGQLHGTVTLEVGKLHGSYIIGRSIILEVGQLHGTVTLQVGQLHYRWDSYMGQLNCHRGNVYKSIVICRK